MMSTEVGTWLLSILPFSRSRVFFRVVVVTVLSLIFLVKNNASARPDSKRHVVSLKSLSRASVRD